VVLSYEDSAGASVGCFSPGVLNARDFRVTSKPGTIAEAGIGMRTRLPPGDENTASVLYPLPKGRASKKISLRTIRPSLNVIKAAARQTPIGSAKSIS
jgi:hypothetical protein